MINKINGLTFELDEKSYKRQSYKLCYLVDLIELISIEATDLKLVAPYIFDRLVQNSLFLEGGISFFLSIIRICIHKFGKIWKSVFEFVSNSMRMGMGLGVYGLSLNLKKSFIDACRIGFGGGV